LWYLVDCLNPLFGLLDCRGAKPVTKGGRGEGEGCDFDEDPELSRDLEPGVEWNVEEVAGDPEWVLARLEGSERILGAGRKLGGGDISRT